MRLKLHKVRVAQTALKILYVSLDGQTYMSHQMRPLSGILEW